MTEDEMVGWHHQFDGYEFEQTLRDSEGLGSLVCCRPWGGHKESNRTEQLNNKNVHLNTKLLIDPLPTFPFVLDVCESVFVL